MPDDSAHAAYLMTRTEVARKFRVTSKTVYGWAHRQWPLLTEIKDQQDDRPKYWQWEVDRLYASGFRGGPTPAWRKDQIRKLIGRNSQ